MEHRLYGQVLEAVLSSDEDEARRLLTLMNQSELSRLRNALHATAELAESQRKTLWRNR
jgi:hypothetical protein